MPRATTRPYGSILTVKVVAIILVLWGLSVVLPVVCKRAMDKLQESQPDFKWE